MRAFRESMLRAVHAWRLMEALRAPYRCADLARAFFGPSRRRAVRGELAPLGKAACKLKSQPRLEELPTAREDVVHALLYPNPLTFATGRAVRHILLDHAPEKAQRGPAQRCRIAFAGPASSLLPLALAGHRRGKGRAQERFTIPQEVADPNLAHASGLLPELESVRG